MRRSRPARGRAWLAVVLLVCALGMATAHLAFGVGASATPADWASTDSPRTLIHHLDRAPWGTLYAGTAIGVYDSTDDGATWHSFGQGLPPTDAWTVTAFHGHGGDVVLAGSGDGSVYRISRTGLRWMRMGNPIGALGVYALLPLPRQSLILAGSDRGIFRASDTTLAWVLAAPVAGGAVSSLARDPRTGAIYAGVAGLLRTVLVSHDGGRIWLTPASTTPPLSVESLLAAGGRVYAGVMRPAGGQAVWVDGAHGFTPLTVGLPPTVHGMSLAASGNLLFVGTMGAGVFQRSASGAWSRVSDGPGDGVVTALLPVPGARRILLAGTGAGVYSINVRKQ